MKKNRIVSIALSVALTLGMTFVSYADSTQMGPLSEDRTLDQTIMDSNTEGLELEVKTAQSMTEASFQIKTRANYELSAEYAILNMKLDNVSASSLGDLIFIKTTGPRVATALLATEDTNLFVQICEVDWSTGTITPLATSAANSGFAVGLSSAGDYCYRIIPGYGTSSANYTIAVNYKYSFPSANISGLSNVGASSNLNNITYWDNSKLYVNGLYVCEAGTKGNANLDFTYTNSLTAYVHHYVDIGYPRIIKKTYKPMAYRSEIQNSNNCLVLSMDVETIYTYKLSKLNLDDHGNVTGTTVVWDDFTRPGLDTPRPLDSEDMGSPIGQYLIYDYTLGKTIDYYGNGNPWYRLNWISQPIWDEL